MDPCQNGAELVPAYDDCRRMHNSMKALVLIDIQNDFLPGGALAVPHGDEILPLVNRLLPHFEIVVATGDWHPASHCSFAASHVEKKPFDEVEIDGQTQKLWPVHCVQGTSGAALSNRLDASRIQHVFHKGRAADTDSYSAFFDQRGGVASKLDEFLKSKHVTDVYLAGLATDYCVKATALDARKLGYRTLVIADACRGVNAKRGDVVHAIAEMRQASVDVISSTDIEAWQPFLDHPVPTTKIAEGKYVRLVRRGTWEFVERTKTSGVVIIVPITDDGHYVFVEQRRIAVGGRCIEFPAGLAGDVPGHETEAFVAAAQRELLEETGYEAETFTWLADASSSAGLTSELVTFFRATNLRRIASGGGVENEEIAIHLVPVAEVNTWLDTQASQGATIAAKVYAGLFFPCATPLG